MSDRHEKVRALLNSPVEGERAAAQAALNRMGDWPPKRGSPEWQQAMLDWKAKREFCVARLGTPGLTQREIVTIRNFWRGGGTPWGLGSDALHAVYRKLVVIDRESKSGHGVQP